MAPPTPDTLYDYLRTLHTEGEHIAFERTYLVDRAWRYFSTTSNAVDKRMQELKKDGRLVTVRVDASGCVFLPEDGFQGGYSLPHFVYHKPYHYAQEEYGEITLKRVPNRQNLWANGIRHLYMTKPAYDDMITDLTTQVAARLERMRIKQAAGRDRLKEALAALAPDAVTVINQLRMAHPDIRVEPRLTTIGRRELDGPEEINLTIDVYSQAGVLPLLDIIRRGLAQEQG